MIIPVELGKNSYPIILERGALSRLNEYLKLDRRVLIVTDDGVPAQYAKTVAAGCQDPVIVTVPTGEESKSFARLEQLCRVMLQHHFTRTDCVVAVGGGVVGDLAGFAAASFLRGIDFYNIPTTVLSQVDSSIGGKVAVNMDAIKNCVGAFYQPKAVVIDPEVLNTLPPRQISNGLAEAVKMAVTFDEQLFTLFESENPIEKIDTVIEKSLRIKAQVVKEDEKETGLRRVLNFGHTIGHGIESAAGLHQLLHGECVALGMLPMCSDALRPRVKSVLQKLSLPVTCEVDFEAVWEALSHDKKLDGDTITVIRSEAPGKFEMCALPLDSFRETVHNALSRKDG